jgi:hypothetical protein
MSTVYAHNVGLGLSFPGQGEEQEEVHHLDGYPHDGTYTLYASSIIPLQFPINSSRYNVFSCNEHFSQRAIFGPTTWTT